MIDADEAYNVLTGNYHHRTETQHEALKEALSKVPTVDAVEVVRCKDCRYYEAENHNCLDEMGYARIWNEDDYCSFAERIEDAFCSEGERDG